MASQTSEYDHTSATYEQVEKKEKEEGIGEKSVSLSNENEEKGDKCEDEAEGKDRKVEVEKTNDSLPMEMEASAEEDDLKTEDKKPNAALVEEGKIDDSSSLEASSVADDLNAEKQMIPGSPPIPAIETLSKPPPTEEQLAETKENNTRIQDKKLDAALVEEEKIDDSLSSEASAADNLKVEKQLILESLPISVNETPLEQPLTEEEPAESREEDLKPDAALIEEEKNDSAADNLSVEKQLISESHPISVIETPPNPLPTEEDNLETKEDNKPDIVLVEEENIDDSLSVEKQLSPESPPISVMKTPLESSLRDEESTKTREDTLKIEDTKTDAALVKEENIDDSSSLEAPFAVADNLKAEKQLIPESPPTEEELVEKKEYKEPHTPNIPTIVNLQIESEAEALKKTENSEALEPEKKSQQEGQEEQLNIEATPKSLLDPIEKRSIVIMETTQEPESDAESVVATKVEENPSSSEKLSFQKGEEEQLKTVPATSAESTDKPGDRVEDHPPKHPHAVSSTDGEKKPMEHSEMTEQVEEKSNDVETKQQLVGEFANSEGTSDDIKEPIPSKEEEETRGIEEKFVEQVGKKEKSCTDVIEVGSKEVEGVLENPEGVSINEEANKTDQSVEENDVVEEEQAKLESDQAAEDDNEKEEKADAETKVDEIAPAVSEPVRETLASKLEKKEEEAITTSKQTAEKPHQKHSNNILWKVKQSLVKAKKAITGKSPTTKSLSPETKADIQVK